MLRKIIVFSCMLCTTLPILANVARDPTRPFGAATQEAAESGLKIDAILGNRNNRMVVIGGRYFKVGDAILGATIVAIDATAIRLKDDSGEYMVRLSNVTVKTPTKSVKG